MAPVDTFAMRISRRDGDISVYDDGDDFWWSSTGSIVRWSLFAALIAFVTLYFILGYMHAKRRIRRGLAPLAYHRFLLSRRDRAQYDPHYRDSLPNYSVHRSEQYGMHAYPPPVYDPNAPAPPQYQPPAGATKVDPSQWTAGSASNQSAVAEPSPEYTPPPGPPPTAALHTNHTGSSNTSNNPYRQ